VRVHEGTKTCQVFLRACARREVHWYL